MDFRRLTYFVAVAERLHFSRAAEDLGIPQPAISQQIKALERELNVQLFDRTGKRVSLTEAGRALLPHARQILAAVAAAENEIRERSSLARGTVSLGAPPTVSVHLLPNQLTEFKRQYPGLEVTLREAGTETLLKWVEEGQLDLAIVSADLLPPVVESTPFLEEEYLLIVGPQHPLSRAARKTVRLADLSGESFILFPEGYRLRELTLGDAKNIQPLRISDQTLRRSLGLVWRKGHYLSPAARALREFLTQNK